MVLVNLGTLDVPTLDPEAIVVVGSGAAGIALTEHLAAHGRSVVLLESGSVTSTKPDERAADLNVGEVHGQTYNGLALGRARALGGATALWHGQCMRMHAIDLEHRPWVAGSGWPFELAELGQYYAAAEGWLGATGRGYGAERWAEHPKLPPVDWDPDYLQHDFTEYLHQPVLARSHQAMLSTHPRILVLGQATVGRILLDDAGAGRGVLVFRPDGRSLEIAGRAVVLAAGAIENARLLQLSDSAGIGLGSGREQTGRYLQDHPIIRTAEVIAPNPYFLQDRYVALHRGRRRLFPKVRLAPAVQRAEGLLEATGVFVHDHDDPALDAARRLVLAMRARRRPELLGQDLRAALRAPLPVARDAYRRYVRGLATGARPSRVWLQLWLEQVPDANSRVSLAQDVDRFGLRRASVDWRLSDLEIETSRRLTRLVGQDLARLGLAQIRELDVMADDDAWRRSVNDAYHPSGTTRMSADPSAGVVAPDLQVHGVPGVYVVGGSVFPIAGYANPTLTIVALALRLARHIATAVRPLAA